MLNIVGTNKCPWIDRLTDKMDPISIKGNFQIQLTPIKLRLVCRKDMLSSSLPGWEGQQCILFSIAFDILGSLIRNIYIIFWWQSLIATWLSFIRLILIRLCLVFTVTFGCVSSSLHGCVCIKQGRPSNLQLYHQSLAQSKWSVHICWISRWWLSPYFLPLFPQLEPSK